MGFWEVAGELAKSAAKSLHEKIECVNAAKEQAYQMNDYELVRQLNAHPLGDTLSGYVQVAKERGTIGRRNGEFYVR